MLLHPLFKLVKLLESKEANHIEFCRIKHIVDEVVQMHKNVQLLPILQLLMHPTWAATGLQMEMEILVNECELISKRIDEMISVNGEADHFICSSEFMPTDFFEDMESSWRGRVKRVHAEEAFAEVERAAEGLTNAVVEDFVPIVSRVKSVLSPLGGPRGEISYSREHEAVWFKGKRFMPTVWAGTPGEEQIKQLKHAIDSKGRKVGDEWFTTCKVDDALTRYHEANALARLKVMEILRGLSVELQEKINILVFSSMLLIVAKALFAHVSEGRRRTWVFPQLVERPMEAELQEMSRGMDLIGLSPYWFDVAKGGAIRNDVCMQSLFILTGPNGGGKSSLLRSICAAALLGICGLMVPAESGTIPHFDCIMLHMKTYDSPADGKSSFQIEMSELRGLVSGASPRSLVLIDEICRGTETNKGTCIAGSIIEALDNVRCLGIVSTHLHGIFDLPLSTKNVVCKAMGTEVVNGRVKPTWKVKGGICRESLAFETAQREGIPEAIIQRAEDLYISMVQKAENFPESYRGNAHIDPAVEVSCEAHVSTKLELFPPGTKILNTSAKTLHKEVEEVVTVICQKKMSELHRKKITSKVLEVTCVSIGAREQPPPSTIGCSSVYIMFRPDSRIYVGQTDDLGGRVRTHRMEEGFQSSPFLYVLVPGKSVASEIETLLINQLPLLGFRLDNRADGKHRNFGTSGLSTEALSLHQ